LYKQYIFAAMSVMLMHCASSASSVRPPIVITPLVGAEGQWSELRPAGLVAALAQDSAKLQAIGDRVYLLAGGVLYRSDDHGAHFSERGRAPLSEFALFGQSVLGWTQNDDAPLYISRDDGLTFRGRPVETYSGDHLTSTGSPRSPVWLRAVSDRVYMVQPSQRDRLQSSSSLAHGWREEPLTLDDRARAQLAQRNESSRIEPQDVAQHGDRLFVCTNQGLFMGRSDQWTHTAHFWPPAFQHTRCEFAAFSSMLCLTYYNGRTTRLHCMDQDERWHEADDGLLSEQALASATTSALAGLGFVTASAELSGHYVLSQRSAPTLAPTLAGVFESDDPRRGWSRVAALEGAHAIAMAHSSRVILLLTRTQLGLRLWRYIARAPALQN
jgi:hypothetical protein